MNAKLKVWHIVVIAILLLGAGFFTRGIFVSQRLKEQAREYQATVDRAEERIADLEKESARTERINTELTEQLERDRETITGLREENTALRERNREQREILDRIADIGDSLGKTGETIEAGLDRVIRAISDIIEVLQTWEDQDRNR